MDQKALSPVSAKADKVDLSLCDIRASEVLVKYLGYRAGLEKQKVLTNIL